MSSGGCNLYEFVLFDEVLYGLSHFAFWSGRPDSNRGPLAPKASALPGCATPRQKPSRLASDRCRKRSPVPRSNPRRAGQAPVSILPAAWARVQHATVGIDVIRTPRAQSFPRRRESIEEFIGKGRHQESVDSRLRGNDCASNGASTRPAAGQHAVPPVAKDNRLIYSNYDVRVTGLRVQPGS